MTIFIRMLFQLWQVTMLFKNLNSSLKNKNLPRTYHTYYIMRSASNIYTLLNTWYVHLISVSGTMSNGSATTTIRVGPTPLLAIVVGSSTPTTWDSVGPKSSIANVPSSPPKGTTIGLRIQQHFIIISNQITHSGDMMKA